MIEKIKMKIRTKFIMTFVLILILAGVLFATYKSFGILQKKQNLEMPNQILMIEESGTEME